MEGAAVDPEFMQKMNTLKWSKDEQFIKTPEYETRKRALFDNHFGEPASLAGAKPPKKKTSTASDEEETSSGNSSASDEEKASSAGSKKKERSTQSKDSRSCISVAQKEKAIRQDLTSQRPDGRILCDSTLGTQRGLHGRGSETHNPIQVRPRCLCQFWLRCSACFAQVHGQGW